MVDIVILFTAMLFITIIILCFCLSIYIISHCLKRIFENRKNKVANSELQI